jgi:hypothetical protein
MEEFDLAKSLDELFKPTDPPKGAALKDTTEVPNGATILEAWKVSNALKEIDLTFGRRPHPLSDGANPETGS